MKIIVSAGGTGGHIYPALAIIKKFQEKEKNLEVLYIGTRYCSWDGNKVWSFRNIWL